jgi:hypothetical protein
MNVEYPGESSATTTCPSLRTGPLTGATVGRGRAGAGAGADAAGAGVADAGVAVARPTVGAGEAAAVGAPDATAADGVGG